MYTMLQDSNKIAAKMSLDVMMELYRKNTWWVEMTSVSRVEGKMGGWAGVRWVGRGKMGGEGGGEG